MPGVEFRIAFLQLLYEIELSYYFCPEFGGHVTNKKHFGRQGKAYVNKHSNGYTMHED